jgi:hypothetical protein
MLNEADAISNFRNKIHSNFKFPLMNRAAYAFRIFHLLAPEK